MELLPKELIGVIAGYMELVIYQLFVTLERRNDETRLMYTSLSLREMYNFLHDRLNIIEDEEHRYQLFDGNNSFILIKVKTGFNGELRNYNALNISGYDDNGPTLERNNCEILVHNDFGDLYLYLERSVGIHRVVVDD